MTLRFFFVAAAAAACAHLAAPRAQACSPIERLPYELDPDAYPGDVTAPSAPDVTEVEVRLSGNNGFEGTSCSGTSFYQYRVAATDDLTPSSDLGFAEVPAGADVDALLAEGRVFIEGSYDGTMYRALGSAQSMDREIDVYAFDAAGNHGPPTRVHLQGDAGCSTGGRRGDASWLAIVMAALAYGVSRRRD